MTKDDQHKDNQQIQNIKAKIAKYKKPISLIKPTNNTNLAFNIAIELTASTITGFIIGTLLDYLFTSKPLFIIVCLILSFIAVFRSFMIKYIKK